MNDIIGTTYDCVTILNPRQRVWSIRNPDYSTSAADTTDLGRWCSTKYQAVKAHTESKDKR